MLIITNPEWAHAVHTLFETLGMAIGARYYVWLKRKQNPISLLSKHNYSIMFGCLAGAAIGNKLAFWIEMPQLWSQYGGVSGFFLGGQSIVGGLLGGLIGVEIAKYFTQQKQSTGDYFVAPVLLGLIIGRLGCFFSGLNDGTYGLQTNLPWAVDFGDGISRHPTQLYEIMMAILLWCGLHAASPYLQIVPGLRFKLFLMSYLIWRLFIETLKPIFYVYPLNLSGIQWICLLAIGIYLRPVWKSVRALHPKSFDGTSIVDQG